MSKIVPFLTFARQAAQAMTLYEKAFGARVKENSNILLLDLRLD